MPTQAWYDTQVKIDGAYSQLREAAHVTDNPVLGQVILDVASIVFELGNYAATGVVDMSALSTGCTCAQCTIIRFVIEHTPKGE